MQFETPTAITTAIAIPAGRIQLIAADRTETVVEIRPANPAKSRDVKAVEETRVDFRDGTLHITSAVKNQLFGATGSVEVTVRLPVGSHVDAKAASAELRGVGRLGRVAYDSAHGTIKIDEASGAHLATQAADITIGRLTGPADITTAKGDITIGEAHRGTLALRTQSGSITVDTARGTSATLDAGTSYGRIHNALKNTGDTPGLAIHATTAHGDITARSL
ncbi:DUF4097 family beta strand repeat-containing protein [Kitasatospora sp. NPDC054939]